LKTIERLPDTAKISKLGEICFQNRYKDQQFAVDCGEKGIQLANSIGNRKLEAMLYNYAGVCYRILGNYEKSLNYFFIALNVFEETKDSVELGYAENNIGSNYLIKSYYSVALDHVKRGFDIFRSVKDKAGMAYCAKALGDIYFKQHKYDLALKYYDSTYILRNEIGYKKGSYTAVLKAGDVYFSKKNYKAALEKYSIAERGFSEVDDKGALAGASEKIALVFIETQNYSKALEYAGRAYKLGTQFKITTSIISSGIDIGIINIKLKNFQAAGQYLNSSLAVARQNNDFASVAECYKAFTDLYEAKGDLKSALKYSELVSIIKDSINIKESIAGAGEMETIYDNQRDLREKTIIRKDVEHAQSQRNYLIIIAALLIAVSVIIFRRYQFKKKASQKLYELNSMKDKFFSIISHDLKNPFHGLIGLSTMLLENLTKKNYESATSHAKAIHNTSVQGYTLLINLLEWARSQTGKIKVSKSEVNIKELLYSIIELVMPSLSEKKISIGVSIEENLVCATDENMLNTVIRNLLSNAVKYTGPNGKIRLRAVKADGNIVIEVEDSGTGIKKEDMEKLFRIDASFSTPGTNNEKGTGLGLILCKDFIEKVGGGISVQSEPGKGARFTVTIPAG
jgi:signal transduction histidine kinase